MKSRLFSWLGAEMRNRLVNLILILPCLALAAHAQYPAVEKEEIRKYNIRVLEISIYGTCDQNSETGAEEHFRSEYDPDGNLTQEIFLSKPNGSSMPDGRYVESTYKYYNNARVAERTWSEGVESGKATVLPDNDENGHLTQEIELNEDGTVEEQHHYMLDRSGKILEDTSSNGKKTMKYDQTGNLTDYAEFEADGSLDRRTHHDYDAEGDRIQTLVYDSVGQVSWKTFYEYDVEGHSLKMEEYDAGGKLRATVAFNRDPKGLVDEQKETDAKGNCTELRKYRYEFY